MDFLAQALGKQLPTIDPFVSSLFFPYMTSRWSVSLSFAAGDRIELIERSENADDWWTGRIDGRTGVFPGTYTQVDA